MFKIIRFLPRLNKLYKIHFYFLRQHSSFWVLASSDSCSNCHSNSIHLVVSIPLSTSCLFPCFALSIHEYSRAVMNQPSEEVFAADWWLRILAYHVLCTGRYLPPIKDLAKGALHLHAKISQKKASSESVTFVLNKLTCSNRLSFFQLIICF